MLGPVDGTWVIRLPPGPTLPGAHVALYRIAPEVRLPALGHSSVQQCLVLRGALRDHTGRLARAGALVVRDAGGDLVAVGDEECLCCVVTTPQSAELRAAG